MPKAEPFLLSALPDYDYVANVACPECYKPLATRKRRDGRCDKCLRDKGLLPINYIKPPKRRGEDEDEREERRERKRYYDED